MDRPGLQERARMRDHDLVSSRPLVFASGSNRPGDLRGFASLGIPPGIAANECTPGCRKELERIARQSDLPIFVDSGAFSEVSADPAKQVRAGLAPSPGVLLVVDHIDEKEWRKRLNLYHLLAKHFGSRLYAVAPDRVGDQVVTLERLERYRDEVGAIRKRGAKILLPMQGGAVSLPDFYRRASAILGFDPVPAFPMKKAGTDPSLIVEFLRDVDVPAIHLLGMGLTNPRAQEILGLIHAVSPKLKISMDSNLIASVVGRGEASPQLPLFGDTPAARARPLTAAQTEIKARGFDDPFGVTEDASWDLWYDWTESAAAPQDWLSRARLRKVASDALLSPQDSRRFVSDPETFLQSSMHEDEDIPWWEGWPPLILQLENAWLEMLQRAFAGPRRVEALSEVFRQHPAAGQFQAA